LSFSAITAGVWQACGLTTAGAAYCWGYNQWSQRSSTPIAVSGGFTFSAITAGERHTCALTGTGAVYCWGYGGDGRLGRANYSAVPVAVEPF